MANDRLPPVFADILAAHGMPQSQRDSHRFDAIKQDDLRTFDIDDDDEGSWSEAYWRERA